ncbi:glycosyltransferase family 4 protein [Sphingopyxis soli]|uniref:Glycosyltransferase family 4 protein n=1 Tax=Sphingopyxis soli TaxID=592051 RepID=A0ABN1LXX0_9SPHN|nr:glycosyltransferase family 4 protein [Sphingopyxis soli]
MRVTFVVASLDMGGGIRVIAQYAEGLRQRGHDVTIVVPAPRPYGRLQRVRNSLPFHKPRHVKSHFDGTGVTVKMLERWRPVRAADVPPADVIIATWWETAEWIADFPEDRGRKFHFVQGYEIWNGDKDRVDAALRLPTQKITVSRWLEAILVDQLGLDPPGFVPNGVDRSLFFAGEREMPDGPTVGFVYAPNPMKGSDIAIEAISLAREKRPELRCIAFGHAEPTDAMPLPSFVQYHVSPRQDRLGALYGRCSAWLFPSREEGFGLPILEAMASGTPVIAMPSGAAPELLAQGGGTLLRSADAREMSEIILEYCGMQKAKWGALSREAIATSLRYSPASSIELFAEIIEDPHLQTGTSPDGV